MIIKIDKNYFKNMSSGDYNIKVNFRDGHASGTIKVGNKISFTIMGETFTATAGMTWADWITSFNIGTSGNGIVWVSPSNQLFLDCRYSGNWDQGNPLGAEEDALYDNNDVRQALNTKIISNGSYGRSSDAPC